MNYHGRLWTTNGWPWTTMVKSHGAKHDQELWTSMVAHGQQSFSTIDHGSLWPTTENHGFGPCFVERHHAFFYHGQILPGIEMTNSGDLMVQFQYHDINWYSQIRFVDLILVCCMHHAFQVCIDMLIIFGVFVFRCGDQIICINGTHLESLSLDQSFALFGNLQPGPVILEVRRGTMPQVSIGVDASTVLTSYPITVISRYDTVFTQIVAPQACISWWAQDLTTNKLTVDQINTHARTFHYKNVEISCWIGFSINKMWMQYIFDREIFNFFYYQPY